MTKENKFSLDGFQQNLDGTYSKKKTVLQPRERNPSLDTYKHTGKHTAPVEVLPNNMWRIAPHINIEKSILTIDGIVAGLNGDEGLMRSHWTKIKKIKSLYLEIIRIQLAAGKIKQHTGPVKITYIGYKSRLMDWDNFCSSFKHIGDSLVKAQIITDDKPSIVTSFIPQQIKCKRIEQKAVIIIEDI